MATYPLTNSANKYARDVVAGRIPACQWVILACQRHLNDLKASAKKGYKYKFDKDKAERAARFVQKMPHTKGKWARERKKLILEPWQLFAICSIFGWVHKRTGFRRFREAFLLVPRKNGKTALAAPIGLYCMAADGEFGAEVYCGATTEKQALEVFTPAKLMVKKTPAMANRFGIEVNAKNLNILADNSKFEPVVGDPGDGSSPHCAIIDEYHEHPDSRLYDTMVTGMGAREQPLTLIITTAGFNIAGPCYEKQREVEQILQGIIEDDEVFGIIYTIDKGDDWTDPASLRKANPNYGVSVSDEYLLAQLRKAQNNPRTASKFKTKHLNIWVSAKDAFFNMEHWRACENKYLTLADVEGWDCFVGVDLASKLDLTAGVAVYSKAGDDGRLRYRVIAPRFWMPEDTVFDGNDKSASERYQAWVEQSYLTDTDGAEIDYRYVLNELVDLNATGQVQEIPIDPHGAANLSHQLEDEGLTVVLTTQNFTNMSDPMKEIEAALKSGRLEHDGNPILSWCISSVIGKYLAGSDDIVRPTKDKASNAKIDGAVGLIMAVGRALANHQGPDETSNYEDPDYGL